MKLTLSDQLKQFLRVLQGALFPTLQEELGPLTEKHEQLVAVLSVMGRDLPRLHSHDILRRVFQIPAGWHMHL